LKKRICIQHFCKSVELSVSFFTFTFTDLVGLGLPELFPKD